MANRKSDGSKMDLVLGLIGPLSHHLGSLLSALS